MFRRCVQSKVSRRRVETSEKLLARAVDLILCGDIGRGLRLIDSNGVSPQDDPQVRKQMLDKHPSLKEPIDWPELPPNWIQLAVYKQYQKGMISGKVDVLNSQFL